MAGHPGCRTDVTGSVVKSLFCFLPRWASRIANDLACIGRRVANDLSGFFSLTLCFAGGPARVLAQFGIVADGFASLRNCSAPPRCLRALGRIAGNARSVSTMPLTPSCSSSSCLLLGGAGRQIFFVVAHTGILRQTLVEFSDKCLGP
jgi:hypothetical protein